MAKRARNPFDYTAAVNSPAEYVGRASMRSRLESLIQGDRSLPLISVTGPRRMGTTSTLNLALHRWREHGRKAVYVDLRAISEIDGDNVLVPRILSELHIEAVHGERWWGRIDSAIPPFVLALDEFDLVQGHHAHSFMSWLVHGLPSYLGLAAYRHRDESPCPLLGIIVGSRQSLFDIERATECIDSPWYTNFTNLRLEPLSRKEAIEMVVRSSEGAGCSLKKEAPWIVRFAGTWPFFLKLACHYVFEHKMGSEHTVVRKTSRQHLEEQIIIDAAPILENMWGWFSPRQCDILSNLTSWQSFDKEWRVDPDVSSLIGQGILSKTRNRLVYPCELFRTYFIRKGDILTGHSVPSRDASLSSIAESLSRLGTCVTELANWDDSEERHIQEIAYVILRSQYYRVRREVHTSDGPKRAYRCDLHVEDCDVVVEVKRVRNSTHALRLQAEMNDDIIGYRQNHHDQRIVFLVWDSDRHIGDREYFRQTYEEKDRLLRIVFVP